MLCLTTMICPTCRTAISDGRGKVRLTDFGLAAAEGSQAGAVVAVLLPMALALYGFRVALAGKPLLGSSAD